MSASNSGSNRRRSGNPATRATAGQSAPNSTPSNAAPRTALDERSRRLLLALSRLPRIVIPAAVLVLMLIGLGAPLPFALPAFGLIAAFVAWLAYLSWPILDTRSRLMRVLMLGIVIGSAVARTQGWL